jgi:hypothetical protein
VVEDDAAAATEGGNGHGLGYLQKTARERRNVFEALVEAVKTHSLGQISHALYDVGGGVSAEYVTAVAPLGITTGAAPSSVRLSAVDDGRTSTCRYKRRVS